MSRFRQVIFWLHLSAGLIAGAVIGIMCLTGIALAFEQETVAWVERDARRINLPAPGTESPPLSIATLLSKLRESHPDNRPSAIVVQNDPRAAVAFSLGRSGALYADPYTGEIRAPVSTRARDFMRTMVEWHRYLALGGDQRPLGKFINGSANLAFCGLALTGLWLWWPRQWHWRALKPSVWFMQNYRGKARDFNWHNVIGFWTAPVLIVLTLTAVPISFEWGSRLIYQLAGEEPPAQIQPGPPPSSGPRVEASAPQPGARPLDPDSLIKVALQTVPRWEQITLRLGAGPRGTDRATGVNHPATILVKEPGSWPRTATTTLELNPFTGELLRRTGYADLTSSRQIRSWTRFLHTGQALGWPGQLVAGLACLGGCFLVYTGYALAWRRFFGRTTPSTPVRP